MLKCVLAKVFFTCSSMTMVILLLVGCTGQDPSGSEPEKENTFDDDLFMSEVIPLANGSAYLKTGNAAYYVNGANAQKVDGLPASLFLAEIVALSDGSALINVGISSAEGLYRLEGAVAEKVTEEPSENRGGQALGIPVSDFYFVEASRLRRELELMNDIYSRERPEE